MPRLRTSGTVPLPSFFIADINTTLCYKLLYKLGMLAKRMPTVLACLSHSFIKLSVCANR